VVNRLLGSGIDILQADRGIVIRGHSSAQAVKLRFSEYIIRPEKEAGRKV